MGCHDLVGAVTELAQAVHEIDVDLGRAQTDILVPPGGKPGPLRMPSIHQSDPIGQAAGTFGRYVIEEAGPSTTARLCDRGELRPPPLRARSRGLQADR